VTTNSPARCLAAALALSACTSAAAEDPPAIVLSDAEQTAVFTAAGFALEEGTWRGCGDPGTLSYTPGSIDTIADLNADGRPEAVISEGSTFCYGNTGTGFHLLSKQGDDSWKLMDSGQGIPLFLDTKGSDDWPDLMVGGPGFCFAVLRWNGEHYDQHRFEYEDEPCVP
jgi:hypothetical protein